MELIEVVMGHVEGADEVTEEQRERGSIWVSKANTQAKWKLIFECPYTVSSDEFLLEFLGPAHPELDLY